MPCTDTDCRASAAGGARPGWRTRWPAWLGLCACAWLGAGCSQPGDRPPPAGASPSPVQPAPAGAAGNPGRHGPHGAPGSHGAAPAAQHPPPVQPAPYRKARNWDDYRQQAAQRLVAINHDRVYGGPVPEPLLAIPVLEIELNGDGSVRRIQVMRKPTQAHDTVQLAIDAVHRAAPFGSVAHLPRPWRFTETFLFDDRRRFKPRSLDG